MHGAADTPKKGSPSTTTFREQRASVEATTIPRDPATNQPCTVRPGRHLDRTLFRGTRRQEKHC
ncbi:hypothetical protein Lal_00045085 [Lupinus albus]|nr:hypothetical protein Lal_00045085 [Lupinus albus]